MNLKITSVVCIAMFCHIADLSAISPFTAKTRVFTNSVGVRSIGYFVGETNSPINHKAVVRIPQLLKLKMALWRVGNCFKDNFEFARLEPFDGAMAALVALAMLFILADSLSRFFRPSNRKNIRLRL